MRGTCEYEIMLYCSMYTYVVPDKCEDALSKLKKGGSGRGGPSTTRASIVMTPIV